MNHRTGESAQTPVEITSFSSNRVTVRFCAEAPGALAFGRIAEPGWSAKIKTIDKGATEASSYQRELVVDRQQETLFLDFESAGDYEVEFYYLPTGFVIGAIVSLISATSLIFWLVASGCFRLKQRQRS